MKWACVAFRLWLGQLSTGLLVGLCGVTGGVSAHSAWAPWVEAEIQSGNRATIGRVSGLVPVWQTSNTMTFGYLRTAFDRNQHIGIAAGQRCLFSNMVIGGYVFYDYVHQYPGTSFHGMTVGTDFYTRCLEGHLNGYIGLGGARCTGREFADLSFENNELQITVGERCAIALSGVDGLLGVRLGIPHCRCLFARALGGGYYLQRKSAGPICGPRGRAELLWDTPRLHIAVGAEGCYDNVRAGYVSGYVRLHIPLGRCCNRSCCRLSNRMTHRIERIDLIIGQAGSQTDCSGPVTAVNGQPVGNLAFINGNTVDVDGALAAAGPGALVIAQDSVGIIDGGGAITLLQNQYLLGEGTTATFSTVKCGDIEAQVPGSIPTITLNANTGLANINDGVTVEGVRFVGSTQRGGDYFVISGSNAMFRDVTLDADLGNTSVISGGDGFRITGSTLSVGSGSVRFDGVVGGRIDNSSISSGGQAIVIQDSTQIELDMLTVTAGTFGVRVGGTSQGTDIRNCCIMASGATFEAVSVASGGNVLPHLIGTNGANTIMAPLNTGIVLNSTIADVSSNSITTSVTALDVTGSTLSGAGNVAGSFITLCDDGGGNVGTTIINGTPCP